LNVGRAIGIRKATPTASLQLLVGFDTGGDFFRLNSQLGQGLRSLIQNLEIFVVCINVAVDASGGFAGNAEFGQVFEGRGHGRHAEFQFKQAPISPDKLKDDGESFNCEAAK
jgi:hypothetical protein